jgi:hypothetical protein
MITFQQYLDAREGNKRVGREIQKILEQIEELVNDPDLTSTEAQRLQTIRGEMIEYERQRKEIAVKLNF